MACLDDNVLVGLIEGRLDDAEAHRAEAHLDTCEDCRMLLAEIARSLASAPGGPGELGVLDRGATVGRYSIQKAIGAGAVGVVYEAVDDELRRRVALKLVRPSGDDTSRDRLRIRVRREARAMAKLAHPNVVAVYDVGAHGDAVFVTMELVDGSTLTEALVGRDWRGVLALFREAGEGLAAAHAAGLVHRDFKPDNVLVGPDGHAKVGDFGIARAAGTGPGAGSDEGGGATLHTKTRGAVGTPAYMAPEQMRGEPVDARADVFAFCVALHEALYGSRPFAGATVGELLVAIERGAIAPAPVRTRVPTRIRSAIVRGLAASTAERTPSMRVLLDELAAASRRTWWPLAAVAVVAVGTLIYVGVRAPSVQPSAAVEGRGSSVEVQSGVATAPPPPPPLSTSSVTIVPILPSATTVAIRPRPTAVASPAPIVLIVDAGVIPPAPSRGPFDEPR
jgi:serine/threonine protein kinase